MDYRQRIIAPPFRLVLPREEDATALFRLMQQKRVYLSRHLACPETVSCEADTLETVRANHRTGVNDLVSDGLPAEYVYLAL